MKRVNAGEPWGPPSARDTNRIINVVRWVEQRMREQRARPSLQRPDGLVLIKNDTASAVDRFGILGIDGPIITPTDNADAFKDRVALSCSGPTAGTHDAKFVICYEPIPAGEYGLAWASGVCQVQINVTDADHAFADITGSDTAKLASGLAGGAQILWKESGTGTKWAIVRFVLSAYELAGDCST